VSLICLVKYSTVQYSTIQYSNTVRCSTAQYSTVQYNTEHYNTIQYSVVQYSKVQYSTIQHNTIQYSTVQYEVIAKINLQFICNFLYEMLIRAYINILRCVPTGHDKNIKNQFPLYLEFFLQIYSDFVGMMGNSVFAVDYKSAVLHTKFHLAIRSAFQGASKKCLYRIAPGCLISCADYLSQL